MKQPPVQVGEIPAMFEGNQGFDDRELRSLVYKTSRGEDRYILVRNAGTNTIGRMETYRIDMNTCLPTAKSEITDFGGQSHEFFLWHDPANSNRVLVYMTNWTSGLPDPDHPGLKTPDLTVLAVTDEDTGEMLPKAKVLASFTLQEVGGPPVNEKPDATGSVLRRTLSGFQRFQESRRAAPEISRTTSRTAFIRRRSWMTASECMWPAPRPGFYVLDSEAVAHHRNAELAAGTAGCNQRSTIVSDGGVIDAAKLPALANDCVHMVVNNDPGLKAYLASSASGAGEGRALPGAADALAFRRLSAGERHADGHAQRRVRSESSGAGEREHQGPSGVRVGDRRERRLPAELRPDDFGGIGDHADHGGGVFDSR